VRFRAGWAGIVFDKTFCIAAAADAARSEDRMPSVPAVPSPADPPDRARARRRDRRSGLAVVIASLVPALRRADVQGLRRAFEESTRRIVGAEHLRLREGRVAGVRMEGPSVQLDVPSEHARPMLLEAVCATTRRFDEWDVQVLAMASHLAAVVLEIERGRSLRPATTPVPRDGAAPLIGSTPVMRTLRQTVERVAATDFTVLIEGESGTGKELVAQQLHDLSRRRMGPFVAVNCAALVETLLEAELFGIEERTATGVRGRRGKFEHADGGTLFLDEVSDLSMHAQAKLLRAIQDLAVERVGGHGSRTVDIRIVAATNRPLKGMVGKGAFRADLYYRLCGVEVHVPALRDRQADILELAEYFLRRHHETRRLELTSSARDALCAYEWPGNVRELQRVVESIVALARRERVELDDLPAALRGEFEEVLLPSTARNESMRAWGSRYARLVLHRCKDNKRQACDVLGISYHTLQAYLRYRDRPPGASEHAAKGMAR
jgi:transcriptional regulator with PAS, ATPase and Fis domain